MTRRRRISHKGEAMAKVLIVDDLPDNREVLAARLRSAIRLKQSYDAVARTNEELQHEVKRHIQTESDFRASEQRVREQTAAIRRGQEEIPCRR